MEELQTALISLTILRKTKEQLAGAMVPSPRRTGATLKGRRALYDAKDTN
jgi:hypothetical protein